MNEPTQLEWRPIEDAPLHKNIVCRHVDGYGKITYECRHLASANMPECMRNNGWTHFILAPTLPKPDPFKEWWDGLKRNEASTVGRRGVCLQNGSWYWLNEDDAHVGFESGYSAGYEAAKREGK